MSIATLSQTLSMKVRHKNLIAINPLHRDAVVSLSVIASLALFWAALPGHTDKTSQRMGETSSLSRSLKTAPVMTPPTAEDIANAKALEQIALSKIAPLRPEAELTPATPKADLRQPTASKMLAAAASLPVPPQRPADLVIMESPAPAGLQTPAGVPPIESLGSPRPAPGERNWLTPIKGTLEDTHQVIRHNADVLIEHLAALIPKF